MKKIGIILCSIFCFLLPSSVYASIDGATLTGKDSVQIGSELSLTLTIDVSDIQNSADTKGIWYVLYGVQYDQDALILTDIASSNWNSYLVELPEGYFVMSEVIEGSANTCVNGTLYCSDYQATLKFFIDDTNLSAANVTVGPVALALLDMTEDREYTIEDIIEEDSEVVATKTVQILEGTVTSVPEQVETKQDTSVTEKETRESTYTAPAKSSNSNLSSLMIDGVDFTFQKEKKEYQVVVGSDVNSLTIHVGLEDASASYTITGADDLAANNNQVTILVTAQDGTTSTYTIYTEKASTETVAAPVEEEQEETSTFSFNKKYLIIAGLALAIVLLIWIVIKLIISIKDRKIKKALDDL